MTNVGEPKHRKMRSAGRSLLLSLHALAGWFLIYIAVGGLVGFAVAHAGQPTPICWPYISVAGVIDIDCSNPIITAFWNFIAGVPRFVIVFPAVAIAFFHAAIRNSGPQGYGEDYFYEGLLCMIYSIPILLLFWAGYRYWRRRYFWIGMLSILVIIFQIAVLGYRM